MKEDRIEIQNGVFGMIWAVLHLLIGIRCGIFSMYHNYDGWTIFWIAVYIVVLLFLDGWLYFRGGRKMTKFWTRYWGFCSGFSIFLIGCGVLKVVFGLWVLPFMFLTPYWLCYTWMDYFEIDDYAVYLMLAVSVLHLLYFIFLKHRAEQKERTHGSLDL